MSIAWKTPNLGTLIQCLRVQNLMSGYARTLSFGEWYGLVTSDGVPMKDTLRCRANLDLSDEVTLTIL